MARKKFFEENNDEEQENLLKVQQQQQHQHIKQNLLGPSSGSGGLGNINPHHHSQQHGHVVKKTNKHRNAVPKTSEESYFSVLKQLSTTGLTIREMPGDGNCLFRALADQLEGHPRNHLDHRRAVVQYMRDNRSDFEPFVEDDEPFEKYVQTLGQVGTFAGNDAIVAFARLHNVIVVIHQLDSPAWLIHPSSEEHLTSNGREVHIAYHNGDHYNSVRKIGDDSDAPSNIKLGLQNHGASTKSTSSPTGKLSPPHTGSSTHRSSTSTVTRNEVGHGDSAPNTYDSVFFGRRDEDYWVKDSADVERLVEEVMQQTDYPDHNFVRDTLMEFNFDLVSTVDFILSMSIIMSQTGQEDQPSAPVEQSESQTNSVSVELDAVGEHESNVLLNMENSHDPGSPTVSLKNELPGMTSPTNTVTTILINTDTVKNFESDERGSSEKPGTPVTTIEITELDEIQASSIPSQNETKFTVRETKAKMSSRQKKDLKKRERKRESDKRKKCDGENNNPKSSTGPPITLASSTFGVLKI